MTKRSNWTDLKAATPLTPAGQAAYDHEARIAAFCGPCSCTGCTPTAPTTMPGLKRRRTTTTCSRSTPAGARFWRDYHRARGSRGLDRCCSTRHLAVPPPSPPSWNEPSGRLAPRTSCSAPFRAWRPMSPDNRSNASPTTCAPRFTPDRDKDGSSRAQPCNARPPIFCVQISYFMP